jgi:hypothetical protein
VSAISDDDQVDIGFLREVDDCTMCCTVGSLPDSQFGVDPFRAKLFDDALEKTGMWSFASARSLARVIPVSWTCRISSRDSCARASSFATVNA